VEDEQEQHGGVDSQDGCATTPGVSDASGDDMVDCEPKKGAKHPGVKYEG
jgi:hypothetical protein